MYCAFAPLSVGPSYFFIGLAENSIDYICSRIDKTACIVYTFTFTIIQSNRLCCLLFVWQNNYRNLTYFWPLSRLHTDWLKLILVDLCLLKLESDSRTYCRSCVLLGIHILFTILFNILTWST